jgi:hypothetical protein
MIRVKRIDARTGQVILVDEQEEVVVESNGEVIRRYQEAVQKWIDKVARDRDYNDGVHCVSYTHSTIPQWKAEADAFIAWRDAVWAYVLALFAQVLQGTATRPTIVQLIQNLPVMVWP